METELIAELRRRIGPHPLVRLGIGDDAAVLEMASVGQCVVTVDMVMDGVDFELSKIDPRRAGRKALAVNLSDLAAMAAEPMAGVVALALPRSGGMALAVALYEGMLPLAQRYGLAIAGGDTNSWDGPLAVSVTLLGRVTPRGPLTRGGARPGDDLLVSGPLGGSILGRHLDFEPRVAEALRWHARYTLHAGIDLSDGLSLDLSRMVTESGCGAVLDLDSVPIHRDAVALSEQEGPTGRSPLDHALADGEDFELLLAVPPPEATRMLAEEPPGTLVRIGQFVEKPGVWGRAADGTVAPLAARGYVHGFD